MFLPYLLLVVSSGVTGWGDCICIILEADTGQDLATTRFGNPKWFLTILYVSPRLDSYLNEAKVEASPRTRKEWFDYPLQQKTSRERLHARG